MNYPFRDPTIEFLTARIDAYAYADSQNRLLADYPKPFYDACLNLLGSHDTERVRTALCGIPNARTLSREEQVAFAPDETMLAVSKSRVLAGFALAAVLPGVPCIYYGDEVGMQGMIDPLNRGTFPWDGGDRELQRSVRALMAVHRTSAAIRSGGVRIAAIGKRMLAVVRDCETETLVLLVNAGGAPNRAVLYPALFTEGPDADRPLSLAGVYHTPDGMRVAARDTLSVTVPANSALLLIRDALVTEKSQIDG